MRILSLASLFLTGCAKLPALQSPQPRVALTDTANTELGELVCELQAALPSDEQAFMPLGEGFDALAARLALINLAEKSIDVQYYLYHNDTVGRLFTQHLIEASERGVQVRLLVDDMATNWKDQAFSVVDHYPNMEVKIFNPFSIRGLFRSAQFLTNFSRANHRMHNKALIVDNQMAIVGGRNIGDEYYAHGSVQFSDLDMLITNGATHALSDVFDRYWNSDQVYPIAQISKAEWLTPKLKSLVDEQLKNAFLEPEAAAYLTALSGADFLTQARDDSLSWYSGQVSVFADWPNRRLESDGDHNLLALLRPSLDAARDELIIISPYFVPGPAGVNYLGDKVKQGVAVSVVTNSLAATDVSAVHAGYSRYRYALLKAGVTLYEMKANQVRTKKSLVGSSKSSLHAKTYIVDRQSVFVGSMNLDPRSVNINTETGVIFESRELAGNLLDQSIRHGLNQHWQVRLVNDSLAWFDESNTSNTPNFTHEPEVGLLMRGWIQVLKLFPIDSQL